jgi:hypothetical protein
VGFYKRYVDDIFCLTRDRDSANSFHTLMNAQHPSISFEIEHPRDNSQLSLLDLNVTISPMIHHISNITKNKLKKEYFYIISQHFHQCTRKTSFIMKGNEDYLDVLQLRTKLTISTSLMLSFDKMDILIILSTKHIPFHIEETMIEIQNGFI